ncbi:isoflavone reductase family protein [Daldinia caldariorum]|uniref:isoflavone reductase family protein n=1 Tax=Daldinia caldariorum TaxID=326644 RepID=UPI0020078A2D|nr:isoflavone reductase family protein [Daldinia caldariorum]KAI1463067.1 isoflavone reductase family protein [Daldinia caldariorum]
MSTAIKVAIVGATGNTGGSIINGLLASETQFEITALARPASVNSEANNSLKSRGIRIVAADLTGPKDELVNTLKGLDIVISCIVYSSLGDQVPLAEAAKQAGVKRFVPCNFSTPAPRGVMDLYDQKDDILAAIQRLYLPYTVIDVGWWIDQLVPALPSGRTDHVSIKVLDIVPGDGSVPIAYTNLPDVGTYVAKIIADPRTLNKKVFAHTETITPIKIREILEELSGEKVTRNYISAEEIEKTIASARYALDKDSADQAAKFNLMVYQYIYSWGIRGDDTPEAASYLGYLDFKELYPGVVGKTVRARLQEILNGK